MESRTALLIFIVGLVHNALCYTPSKFNSHANMFNVKRMFKNPSVREALSAEQIFLPSPITVLEIQRQVIGDAFMFTVKYNSTQTPVVEEWKKASGTPGREVGNGVYETTALTSSPPSDLDGCVLLLYTSDYREGIWVWLKLGEDGVETNIPELLLNVEPAGDFVYNEGEDFVFKGRFAPDTPIDMDGYIYLRFAQSKVLLLDLDTGKAITDFADSDHFDILDWKSYQNYKEMTVKLKTSERRLSGIISLQSGVEGPIAYTFRNKDVFLYPSTQTGPFPDGYLGFVKDLDSMFGDDIVCAASIGHRCKATCIAAGEGITEIKVERLKADGGVELLNDPVHLAASYKTPYLQDDRVTFYVDSMDQPEKIRCTAKNAAGAVISKETPVEVY